MKCPHCKKEIDNKLIARSLAKKGGQNSKRDISPEAQAKMQIARKKAFDERRKNKAAK